MTIPLDRRMMLLLITTLAVVVARCGGESGGGGPVGDANFDEAVCATTAGPFSTTIDNPYFPFVVGAVHVIEGLEAGTDPVVLNLMFTGETEEIAGVTTRVLKAEHWEDGELVALSSEFFAQAPDGTVCSFGEEEDEFDEGELVMHYSFRAGVEEVEPGVVMPGTPTVGQIFVAAHRPPEIDKAEVTHVGEPLDLLIGTLEDTVTILEDGPSIKRYARDIGMVYDDELELSSH